jgi:uncharacterized membrane protein YccC
MMTSWLPLTEYSSKYHVSISTLRRRIKTDSIKYQFNDGRYLIFDQSQEHRPSQASMNVKAAPPMKKEMASKPEAISLETREEQTSDEPILTAANRLLSELKKAYTQILQEKEEQILHLKEEVSDLKTLVRVLESENDRLRR